MVYLQKRRLLLKVQDHMLNGSLYTPHVAEDGVGQCRSQPLANIHRTCLASLLAEALSNQIVTVQCADYMMPNPA
jgi:hypothetical protein